VTGRHKDVSALAWRPQQSLSQAETFLGPEFVGILKGGYPDIASIT